MKRYRIIDNLIVLTVALYISGFLNFIAIMYLKQSTYIISSIATTIALFVYLVRNITTINVCLKSKIFIYAIIIIWIYPLFTFAFSPLYPIDILKEILKHTLSVLLMLYFICLFVNNDKKALNNLFLLALLSVIFGGLLSNYAPAYFNEFVLNRLTRSLGEFAGFRGENYQIGAGRAFGFQLQPNAYSLLTATLLFGYLYFTKTSSVISKNLVLLLAIFAVTISGSRSGAMATICIMVLFLLHATKTGLQLKNDRLATGISSLSITLLSLTCAVIAFVAFKAILFPDESVLTSLGEVTPIERFKRLFSSDIQIDESLTSRMEAQFFYIGKAFSSGVSLFTGNGYGSTSAVIESNEIDIYSHNFWVNSLFEYGLIYIVSFLLLLICIFARIKRFKNIFLKNALFDSLPLLLILTFSGVLFSSTTLPTIFGVIVGLGVLNELSENNLTRTIE